MKAIQKVIYTGFAAVAIASASMPVFPAHTVPARGAAWQGVDFDVWVQGRWIVDDCAGQVAIHDFGGVTMLAQRPVEREFVIRR